MARADRDDAAWIAGLQRRLRAGWEEADFYRAIIHGVPLLFHGPQHPAGTVILFSAC